jgi:hypothetical protein
MAYLKTISAIHILETFVGKQPQIDRRSIKCLFLSDDAEPEYGTPETRIREELESSEGTPGD